MKAAFCNVKVFLDSKNFRSQVSNVSMTCLLGCVVRDMYRGPHPTAMRIQMFPMGQVYNVHPSILFLYRILTKKQDCQELSPSVFHCQ